LGEKKLTIGITGSKGFIGSHLNKAISEKGWKVLTFDKPENNLLQPDTSKLKKFVSKSDIIIHTAAVNRGTDTEVISGSLVTTFNLVSEIKKNKNNPKLIYLSSVKAENDSVYGLSKRLTETMLEDFSKNTKNPVTIFRITNVFGEGCKPFYNSVIATFCHQVAKGKKLKVNKDSKKISFIYIKDLINLIIKESLTERKKLFCFKEIKTKDKISVPNLAKLIKSFKNIKNPNSIKSEFHKKIYKTYLSYV
jgi:UDP-2-acetamido-2,6-beta-L-arabino-hexul-4-ose reductase